MCYKLFLIFRFDLCFNKNTDETRLSFSRLLRLSSSMNSISCIFSEKLVLEKGRVATTPFSEGVLVIHHIINQLQGSKKEKEVISDLLSKNAPPPGLEPGTP